MPTRFPDAAAVMRHALDLARRGRGYVEPNPQVGAVLVNDQLEWIAEGFHERFGGPHAEVHALQSAGSRSQGAHLFVTLEPCAHHGKTPPCAEAVIAAGVRQVTIGCADPAPHTAGQGIAKLREAGLEVHVGLLQEEAQRLLRPFTKRMLTGLPYVHAKWAMTLDGKLATHTGSSQWISGSASRAVVHELRGRMDAILVGRGTVEADDPRLTVRPPGPRVPVRVVLDSVARLPMDSQLVRTAHETPVLLVCQQETPEHRLTPLQLAGVEVLRAPLGLQGRGLCLEFVLRHLASRGATNVLIEGGGELLGSCVDSRLLDEVHVFIAPKLVGGARGLTPVGGMGIAEMQQALRLEQVQIQQLEGDVYVQGEFPLPLNLEQTSDRGAGVTE